MDTDAHTDADQDTDRLLWLWEEVDRGLHPLEQLSILSEKAQPCLAPIPACAGWAVGGEGVGLSG